MFWYRARWRAPLKGFPSSGEERNTRIRSNYLQVAVNALELEV